MATTFVMSRSWTEGSVTGKKHNVLEGVLTTDGADGAAVGDIAATIFPSLTVLVEVYPLVKDDNTLIVVAAPSYNGTSLIGKAAATAAPADIPAGSYKILVKGY